MGARQSTQIARTFEDVKLWPWARVHSAVKSYTEGDYDFGVGEAEVMSLTGYSLEETKDLISHHSRNDSGIVNAITLLVSMVSLADASNRNERLRFETIFDLVDFNKSSSISMDELAILILCIGSSYAFILAGPQPTDQIAIKWAQKIYTELDKKSTSHITKEEVISWISVNLWKREIYYMDEIFDLLHDDPEDAFRRGIDGTIATEDKQGETARSGTIAEEKEQ